MPQTDERDGTSARQNSAARQFLLMLLGQERLEDRAQMLALLRQVNWPEFLEVTSEDLYPYVGSRLEPYVGSLETPPEWERFSEARRLTAIHNLRLRHELGKVLDVLRQHEIPALALKGIVLAHTSYPELSLRPMSDLDLLVPPEKREAAVHVVQMLGYEYSEAALATHRNQMWDLAANEEVAPPLRHGTSGTLLEIHSQLECSEPILPMPVQEFWSRSILVEVNGLKVRTLCAEDFLLHLCLHQSRHHRFEKGFLPLIDLRLLIESQAQWNWSGIVERCLRCGCATWMYLSLELARDLVGAPIPDTFFRGLSQPNNLPELRRIAEDQLWSAKCEKQFVPGLVSRLLAEPSWRTRARMVGTRIRPVGRREDPGMVHPAAASLVQRARLEFWRLITTLKVKVPRYIFAWRSGYLNSRAIQRKATVRRASNSLFQLVEGDMSCGRQRALAGVRSTQSQ